MCVCVMVRSWGTEDKGLRTDHVLVGRFFRRVPGSQRGYAGKRKEWLCLSFGFRGAVGAYTVHISVNQGSRESQEGPGSVLLVVSGQSPGLR